MAKKVVRLTGPEKVAVLMVALGENSASKILAKMDEREIHTVGNYMSLMENITPEQIEAVSREFFAALEGGEGGILSGGKEYLKKMLENVMDPAKAAEVLAKLTTPGGEEELGGGLDIIRQLDTKTVVSFLTNEHPQTVAIILAHIEPGQAAEVLKELPERFQSEVMLRLATLERINPSVLADLDRALAAEFQSAGAMEGSALGGVERVAEIVNNLDHNLEVSILSELESTHPELAEQIRNLMFVFEDLTTIDDRGMQTILKEISNEELLLALKTSSDGLKDKILSNMSKRAAEMLREDLESMGPVKLSDVEKSQQSIIRLVKKLEDDGKIVLAGGGEELV